MRNRMHDPAEDSTKNRDSYLEKVEEDQKAIQARMRAQLVDVSALQSPGPAEPSKPTFLLGKAHDFPHQLTDFPDPARGNLSPQAEQKFFEHLTEAATRPEPSARNNAADRAATVVAKDLIRHNEHSKSPASQVAFATRELGERLGLNKLEADALGHTVGRALEKQGIKVFVGKAIDGFNHWRETTASTATMTGLRHNMEESLTKLAEHGVTANKIKQFLGNHSGKIGQAVNVAAHADELTQLTKAAMASGVTLDGIAKVAGDKEVRHAAGNLVMSAGDTASSMPGMRAAGSIAIVAGSIMAGESHEDLGKHLFRASASIAGGALGSVGGIFGTVAGAEAGAWAANKMIEFYEKHMDRGGSTASYGQQQDASARLKDTLDRSRDGGLERQMEMAFNKR